MRILVRDPVVYIIAILLENNIIKSINDKGNEILFKNDKLNLALNSFSTKEKEKLLRLYKDYEHIRNSIKTDVNNLEILV